MTSYEFEVAAKNAAIDMIKYKEDIDVTIDRIHTVWFAYVLNNKKCMLFAEQIPYMYIEVTYSTIQDEMYVDLYEKHLNRRVTRDKFDFEAHV